MDHISQQVELLPEKCDRWDEYLDGHECDSIPYLHELLLDQHAIHLEKSSQDMEKGLILKAIHEVTCVEFFESNRNVYDQMIRYQN